MRTRIFSASSDEEDDCDSHASCLEESSGVAPHLQEEEQERMKHTSRGGSVQIGSGSFNSQSSYSPSRSWTVVAVPCEPKHDGDGDGDEKRCGGIDHAGDSTNASTEKNKDNDNATEKLWLSQETAPSHHNDDDVSAAKLIKSQQIYNQYDNDDHEGNHGGEDEDAEGITIIDSEDEDDEDRNDCHSSSTGDVDPTKDLEKTMEVATELDLSLTVPSSDDSVPTEVGSLDVSGIQFEKQEEEELKEKQSKVEKKKSFDVSIDENYKNQIARDYTEVPNQLKNFIVTIVILISILAITATQLLYDLNSPPSLSSLRASKLLDLENKLRTLRRKHIFRLRSVAQGTRRRREREERRIVRDIKRSQQLLDLKNKLRTSQLSPLPAPPSQQRRTDFCPLNFQSEREGQQRHNSFSVDNCWLKARASVSFGECSDDYWESAKEQFDSFYSFWERFYRDFGDGGGSGGGDNKWDLDQFRSVWDRYYQDFSGGIDAKKRDGSEGGDDEGGDGGVDAFLKKMWDWCCLFFSLAWNLISTVCILTFSIFLVLMWDWRRQFN